MLKSDLRKRFESDVKATFDSSEWEVLVLAVRLPSGAVETMTNYQDIPIKIADVLTRYDDEFRLKNNPSVSIVGYMLV